MKAGLEYIMGSAAAAAAADKDDVGSVKNSLDDVGDRYDDDGGGDDPKAPQLLKAMAAHARYHYDLLGRIALALAEKGMCVNCGKPHVVECKTCNTQGVLLCWEQDVELHTHSAGEAHARFTLTTPPGMPDGRPVLTPLERNEYIFQPRAGERAVHERFGGVDPGEIDLIFSALPFQAPSPCGSCGSLRAAALENQDETPGATKSVSVWTFGSSYKASVPVAIRCCGLVDDGKGGLRPCGAERSVTRSKGSTAGMLGWGVVPLTPFRTRQLVSRGAADLAMRIDQRTEHGLSGLDLQRLFGSSQTPLDGPPVASVRGFF